MNKVLINSDYGGIGSEWPRKAFNWVMQNAPHLFNMKLTRDWAEDDEIDCDDTSVEIAVPRHHPDLIMVAEKFDFNNDENTAMHVVKLKNNLYRIREYDGMEWVEEPEDITWEDCDEAAG